MEDYSKQDTGLAPTDDQGTPKRWLTAANLLCLAGYAALVVAIVISMNRARAWAVDSLANESALASWEEFRHDAQEFSRSGPVHRRVPPSSEPPTLRLLRDHYAASLAAALFFSSAVYWSVALLLRGVLASGRTGPRDFARQEHDSLSEEWK